LNKKLILLEKKEALLKLPSIIHDDVNYIYESWYGYAEGVLRID